MYINSGPNGLSKLKIPLNSPEYQKKLLFNPFYCRGKALKIYSKDIQGKEHRVRSIISIIHRGKLGTANLPIAIDLDVSAHSEQRSIIK